MVIVLSEIEIITKALIRQYYSIKIQFITWQCGKELMSRDELAVMDGNKCILQLRGVRPFLSDKFDITRHKRYKQLSDYDKKNAFDVEAYMKHQLKIRMKEEFDLYEVDGSEETAEGTTEPADGDRQGA